MTNIARIAEQFAREAHGATNHMYDGRTYADGHLAKVVGVFHRFKYLLPDDKHDIVEAGAWVHDAPEDARVTYNQIKQKCGLEVAELAYALTNEKGRTRKDRANDKYYQGIRDTPFAAFVKCCDRIANIEHGLETGGNMVGMYRKEHEDFFEQVYTEELADMFDHMEEILAKQ